MSLRSVIQYPGQRLAAFVLSSLMAAGPAAAADGLNEVVGRGTELAKTISTFLQVGFMAAGVGAAGWGVWQCTVGRQKRQQSNDGIMVPMLAILGGTLLTSLIYAMGTISTTVFGANQVSVNGAGGF